MGKKNSLKINFIFNAFYQVLILLVPLITTPYISRVLGANNNGIYANFYSLVQYFVLITSFGFIDYGTKVIAENRDNNKNKTLIFASIYFSRFIFGFLSLTTYLVLIFTLFSNVDWLLASIFSIYIVSATIDPLFYFQGEERFVSICIRNLSIRVISTIFIFVFVKTRNDLIIYTLILALSQLLATLIIIPNVKFKEFVKFRLNELDLKDIVKKSFAYFVPYLAVTLFSYLNQTLIGFFGGSDAESGYYAQAIKIVQILISLTSSLNIIMLSRISYLNAINNEQEIKIKVLKTFEVFWLISLPLVFGVCAISSTFIPVFLGADYDKCVILVYILSPTIVFASINGLYGSLFFRPKNKIWIQSFLIFLAALVNLFICVILIPLYGSIGTSIGRTCAEIIQFPFLMFFARKYIDFKMVFKTAIKPLISSVLMFIITFLMNYFLSQVVENLLLLTLIIIFTGALSYGMFELLLKDPILYSYFVIFKNKILKK